MKTHKTRVTSTGESSHKYGPCEVCGEHASEVFVSNHQVRYADGLWYNAVWTYYDAMSPIFGHEACLKSILQKATNET